MTAISKSIIWVMDAMVEGLYPSDRKPILVTANPGQTGGQGQAAFGNRSFGAGANLTR